MCALEEVAEKIREYEGAQVEVGPAGVDISLPCTNGRMFKFQLQDDTASALLMASRSVSPFASTYDVDMSILQGIAAGYEMTLDLKKRGTT